MDPASAGRMLNAGRPRTLGDPGKRRCSGCRKLLQQRLGESWRDFLKRATCDRGSFCQRALASGTRITRKRKELLSLIGRRFGLLTVRAICVLHDRSALECNCRCGSPTRATVHELLKKGRLSCGCLGRAKTASRNRARGMKVTARACVICRQPLAIRKRERPNQFMRRLSCGFGTPCWTELRMRKLRLPIVNGRRCVTCRKLLKQNESEDGAAFNSRKYCGKPCMRAPRVLSRCGVCKKKIIVTKRASDDGFGKFCGYDHLRIGMRKTYEWCGVKLSVQEAAELRGTSTDRIRRLIKRHGSVSAALKAPMPHHAREQALQAVKRRAHSPAVRASGRRS